MSIVYVKRNRKKKENMKNELNFNHTEIPKKDLSEWNGGSLILPVSRFSNLIIVILSLLDRDGII